MTRFNKVVLSDDKSTVAVGPGLIWDDVYATLVVRRLSLFFSFIIVP